MKPWRIMIGLGSLYLLLNLTGCQTPLEPCNSDESIRATTHYTEMYLNCLEDVGNLRQQKKACEERVP